jgi:hypothetical protein
MSCELWETESATRIGEYESFDVALDAVRRAVERDGEQYARSLMLTIDDEPQAGGAVLEGDDLVRRAMQSAST